MLPAGVPVTAADLAPGDQWAAHYDWRDREVTRVRSADDPWFARAYEVLWREFGARNEMERHGVIADRLAWDPASPAGEPALLYELVVVHRAGDILAVRDHTAILPRSPRRQPETDSAHAPPAAAVVHLSHVWVDPRERGTGLGAWTRALPIEAARECARALAVPLELPITLVAEMEYPDPRDPMTLRRLRSYERAGFGKIDPLAVSYRQPDFRAPEEIDRTGPSPVPLTLVVRRVGHEGSHEMSGAEVRSVVEALYAMYGRHARSQDLAPLRADVARLPAAGEVVALVPPTQEEFAP